MKWIAACLALVSFATTARIYQMPLTKIESARVRMIREGKWAAYLQERNLYRTMLVRNDDGKAVHSQAVSKILH